MPRKCHQKWNDKWKNWYPRQCHLISKHSCLHLCTLDTQWFEMFAKTSSQNLECSQSYRKYQKIHIYLSFLAITINSGLLVCHFLPPTNNRQTSVNVCTRRMRASIDLVTEMELCLPSQELTQICIYTGDEMRY